MRKYAPTATNVETTIASTTFFFSGRSPRYRYPKMRVDAMERNPRSVVVTRPSLEMSVNAMRADTAQIKDAAMRGTMYSRFEAFRANHWWVRSIGTMMITAFRRLRTE